MKKRVSYILLFTIIFTIFTPIFEFKDYNRHNVYGSTSPELETYKDGIELENVAKKLGGVAQKITVEGKAEPLYINKYWLNVFPKEKRLLVYGTRLDVPNNTPNQGFYRYVGYNVNKQPMGNPNYPPDQGGNFHPKDRQWRKYTWDKFDDIGVGYGWKYDEILRQRQNGGSIILPDPGPGNIYTTTPDWMRKGTWTNGNGVPYTMSDFQLSGQLHEYIYVQQAPTDYTVGTGIMYHRDASGNWWYIQIIFKPTKPIESTHNVLEIGVLVHPTTNPAESYVQIDGKHYKFVRNINNYDGDKYYKFHYGDEGTSVTINQRPQPYYYVGNSYSEGIVLTKFPNGTYSDSRTVVIKDEVQYVGFFYTEESDLDVDFDIIYNGQNVTSQVQNGIPIKIKKTDFPLTLNFQDKSVSELGQINSWDWTMLNQQTFAMENFATAKNPNKSFPTEENFRKYFNGNTIAVKLDVTDTFNNRGNKTKFIPFEIEEEEPEPPSGANVVITGTADPVAIPHGYPWGSGKVDFTIKAMDLAPGEQILEWHTEQKRPRHESLGYTDKIKHETTGSQFPRTVHADVSHDKNRVWLKAELKTNRGTYTKEGYVDVPTSQQSQPPIAVIEGPTVFSAGDKVTFDGTKSYSPVSSHYVEEYWWEMPGAATILTKNEYGWPDKMKSKIEAYFTIIGQHRIELDVWNNARVGSKNPAVHIVTVTEPYPTAVISIGGNLKENRKVTLDSSGSTGNEIYPIVDSKTTWMIYPNSGQNVSSIKVDGVLNSKKIDVLFKAPGEYKIVLYVENTYGNHDLAEQIITIQPDQLPIAKISTTTPLYRDPQNNNKATIRIEDESYSPDSDYIERRVVDILYDANNDGVFNDGSLRIDDSLFTNGQTRNYSQWGQTLKVTVYKTGTYRIIIEVEKIGKYRVDMTVIEGFGQPTIDKFVSTTDRRKSDASTIIEVDNLPPVAEFSVTEKKKVDLVFNISDTNYNSTQVESQINSILKPQLEAKNIDYNIKILDNRPSIFSKIFFNVNNHYDYNSLFQYDYNTEEIIKLDRSSFGSNLMLATNGKLYYMKDTSIINGTSSRRFAIYEYDYNTKIETQIYQSAENTMLFKGHGQHSHESYIAHDNSIYFFEELWRGGSNYDFNLRKFDINTRAVTTLYSHTYNSYNHWTHDGDNDYRIVGVDKFNNIVIVNGFRKNHFHYSYEPPKEHNIIVIRPNGNIAVIANHSAIDTSSVRMNINGDIVYKSREIVKLSGYPYYWTPFTTTKISINSLGNVTSREELNSSIFNEYSIVDFSSIDNDKLILTKNISGMRREYKYSLSSKTLSNNYTSFPLSHLSSTGNLYGNKKIYSFYPNHNYLYDEITGEIKLTGIKIDRLAQFNIPSYSYYDDEERQWYNYSPNIRLGGFQYQINKYANPNNIKIPYLLDKVIDQAIWREHADRVVVNLNQKSILELNDKEKLANIIANTLSNEVNLVGFGSNANQSQYQNLLNQHLSNKGFHTKENLDTSMQQLVNYIIQVLDNKELSSYVLLGQELEWETHYSDKENDPKITERWRFTHNHNYFTNSLGQIPDSGVFRGTPYTIFNKVGLFQTVLQMQDNPTTDVRFINYRRWSDDSLARLNLYVHRRPIANFHYSLTFAGGLNWTITLNNQSYDLDHSDKASLGIAEEKWRFKEVNQASWTNSKPTTLLENKIYLVELRVKDLEGEWSYPIVKVINTDPNQMPPTIIANPNKTNGWFNQANFLATGDLRVNLIAQAYGSKTISEMKYSWSTSIVTPGAWTSTPQANIILTQGTDNIWYLHAQATDSTSLSASAVFGPYNVDKTPPTAPGITNNQNWTNAAQVPVSTTPGTDNLSGVARTEYRLNGATTLNWTIYSSIFNVINAGTTNISARTIDIAGNPSNERTSIVRIDRIPPTVDVNIHNGEFSDPVNLIGTASDTGGSGLNYVRYRWTNSTTKPTSGWITTTQSTFYPTQAEEGVWYLHMEAFDNAGNSFYRHRGPYDIQYLKLTATLVPNPALAGDQLIFTVDTEGFAERIEIIVPNDITNKDNREQQGYTKITYPLTYNVNGSIDKKRDIFKYVLWHTTDQTLTKDNVRLRETYKFTVRAWRGTKSKEVELELDVRRSILELIKPGIKGKN